MNNYIFNKTLTGLLIIQLFLVSWAAKNPLWVEKYYSRGIYPEISGFFRRLLGWIPLSVGDILYGVLFITLLGWVWYLYETRFTPFLEQILRITAFISVLFFGFHILWGLNYHRVPLQKQLGIQTLEFDRIALQKTTEKHLVYVNNIHQKITSNDSVTVTVPYSRNEIYKMAAKQYRHFKHKDLELQFRIRSIKNSLINVPLSYMGFSGYLNPFTGESQVNKKIPLTTFPVTTTHEMAHQLGFASETEANYIGYLACVNHKDIYFKYSGELMAVRFLIFEVSKYNPELADQYYHQLHYGIQKNIEQNQDFWDSYKTPVKRFFYKIFDKFLKVNKQPKGLKSYNAMVGFLVNDYQPLQ